MQADYYREYYSLEREHWWFMARKKILQDQLRRIFKTKSDLKILNVGAAFGATTIMLQEFGEVTSIEYNKECCDYVNEKLKLNFVHGSITSLPFNESEFDLVCAFDVVEHVEDDKTAIAELHRVCKPDGYVFTTVPAFKLLWSDHDVINEHIRRYKMGNFLALFEKRIAIVQYRSYFNFFLFLPVAVFRIVMSWVQGKSRNEKPRSDNSRINKGMISNVLYKIFKSETFFLKRGLRFPFGISLMVISKKV